MPKNSKDSNLVVIVGRPNVGKSTLFNRLIGKRQAIETAEAGTTRDWLVGECSWRNKTFQVVDMAGMHGEEKGDLGEVIRDSIDKLIHKAKIILFLVDAKAGLTPADEKIAEVLRKLGKPIYLVANKSANPNTDILAIGEFARLGFEKNFSITAISGRGLDKLLDAIVKNFSSLRKKPVEAEETAEYINVAILGRPNVGKSTLFNQLIGENRALVSEAPGTTRDTVESVMEIEDNFFRFIDTAGIRKRKARSEKLIEKLAVLRAEKIVENSDIVLLVLDGVEGITQQDLHILELVDRYATGLLILINKKDLISGEKSQRELQIFREKAQFVNWAQILFISAKTKANLEKIPKFLSQIFESRKQEFPQEKLQEVLRKILQRQPVPQAPNCKKIKLLGISQAGTNPPCFRIFSNFPEKLHFSYKRFIKKELYQALGFFSTALKIYFSRQPEK